MPMWTLSRYFLCFLSGFPFGGLGIVAKYPIVEGIIKGFTRLSLVAVVRLFYLRKRLQPKILWRFSDSNFIVFLQGAGFDDGVTDGILYCVYTGVLQSSSGLFHH